MKCALCGDAIEGQPFTLSDLNKPPEILDVCGPCSASTWITLDHDGVEVEVFRDDLIQCDRERLDTAIEDALAALDRLGWEGEALRLSGMSEQIKEPWRPGP